MSDTIDIAALNSWLDSRDIIRRREDLLWNVSMGYLTTPEEAEELAILEQFIKQGEYVTDWEAGATVIADCAWQDYARDLVRETMPDQESVDRLDQWPWKHLDWEAIADELQDDYRDITIVIGGTPHTFWVR